LIVELRCGDEEEDFNTAKKRNGEVFVTSIVLDVDENWDLR